MHWLDAHATLLKALIEQPRLGLVTDVDGTISPFVSDPGAAEITPRARDLLVALKDRLALVAVISGRSAPDVAARVGVPGLTYVGNHGMELWLDGKSHIPPQINMFRPQIEAAVEEIAHHAISGVLIEDKGATLAVHYRNTPDPEEAARILTRVLEGIASKHGLHIYHGQRVIELRPPLDVHKGSAFRQLVLDHKLAGALYIGDDTTDVDALAMARRLRAEGVCYTVGAGVESGGTPAAVLETADIIVPGIPGVEALLSWLLEAVR